MPKKADLNVLIPLLKKRDEWAFGEIYNQYSETLYGILCKIVKDDDEAENLLQDSFVKIWKRIEDYDISKGTFFTWVLNIARNTGIDYLRSKNYLHNLQNQDINDYVSMELGTIPNLYLEQIGLKDLVEKLDIQLKNVILKIYFEGCTHEEAAEELGIPLGTLKTRWKNGLKELRQMF